MTNAIVPQSENSNILALDDIEMLKAFNTAADKHISENRAISYRNKKSANTRRAHDRDLLKFAEYIETATGVHIEPIAFYTSANIWQHIGRGLIETFREWMLSQEYAISSVNRALATVRKYAELAYEADYIDEAKILKIRTVKGYSGKEAKQRDNTRLDNGVSTRKTDDKGRVCKKARWVTILDHEADKLLAMPDTSTPQGRRDSVLLHLLLHHGMRASEVAALTVDNINTETWEMTFDVIKTQSDEDTPPTHNLFPESSLPAMHTYLTQDALSDPDKPLLRASKKNGQLSHAGISSRTITRIVNNYGREIGKERLSAHDCRHYAATFEANHTRDFRHLMDMFNWKTPAMALHYVEDAKIKNEKSARL